jgi:hypothetical protein
MNVFEDLSANRRRPSQLLKDSEELIGRGDPNTYCFIILGLYPEYYVILFGNGFP